MPETLRQALRADDRATPGQPGGTPAAKAKTDPTVRHLRRVLLWPLRLRPQPQGGPSALKTTAQRR